LLALLDLAVCILSVALMAHLSPTPVLEPVALAALYLAASLAVARMLRRSVADLADGEERRYTMLFDSLANIQSVKALGLERQMLRRHERLAVRCAASRRSVTLLSANGHGAALLLASIGSGKTALLGLISGEAQPSVGRVLIDGTDLAQVDPDTIAETVA
jgi:ATP-binding cassette subfamily C protein LapB